MPELERFLNFAREATYEAGRLTLGYYARTLDIIDKADGSPVTVADREAETLIRQRIEQSFPDHGICGEEHGTKQPAAGCSYTWYIDPIDGTKSFIHGAPLYTTLLALVRDGRSVAGVIMAPATGEQVSAAEGHGCWLNGRPVRVSPIAQLRSAVISYTDWRDLERNAPKPGWRAVMDACRFARGWSDAYGYLMVATGRAEAMMDPEVNAYDIAPLPVIMKEAGGAFFDWNGEETIFGGSSIACNRALENEIRQTVVASH